MFKRYPYWGWLTISLVLWCIVLTRYYAHRKEQLPERMANVVNKDVANRTALFDALVIQEPQLINHMFNDSLTESEIQRIRTYPFYVYAYNKDSLKFWSNNSVIAQCNDSFDNVPLMRFQNGVFIHKCLHRGDEKKLVVLIPLRTIYPLENDYLHEHFAASENIPVSTIIADALPSGSSGFPLFASNDVTAGYLIFNKNDIQKWIPDNLQIALLLAALLSAMAWLQLMVIQLTHKRRVSLAFIIIAGIIFSFRILLYAYGLPLGLDLLTIFSPSLYASNKYLPSLGDLLINIALVLWMVMYVYRHTPYRNLFKHQFTRVASLSLSVLACVFISAYVLLFTKILRTLILDSSISFDVTHFYAINIYTFYGLFAIVSIVAISCVIIYFIYLQLSTLISNRWMRYLLLTGVFFILLLLLGRNNDEFSICLLIGTTVYVFLLDLPYFKLSSRLFEPHMIVWAVLVCLFATGMVHYFNSVKEHRSRLAFVELHLAPHRDDVIEFSFDNTAKAIERDLMLKEFFYKPTSSNRKLLNQHFDAQYLTGPVNKYETTVYLFDKNGTPLYNKDTTRYDELLEEKTESVSTNSSYLFYKESILDRHYYLSYIRIYSDTVNNVIGYVIIDLDLKKSSVETVYPELLKPADNKATTGDNNYAYAVYINGLLINQTNDYTFPVRLYNDTLNNQQYRFYEREGMHELQYKIADKRSVVVVHNHSELIETITLFSYLFGTQIIIAIIILGYQFYLSYITGRNSFRGKISRLTLRRRVHLSMLAIVFVSFSIIGYVTINFFSSEYRSTNLGNLRTAMQVAKQSVQDYLAKENAFNTDEMFDTVSRSPLFKSYITSLAADQKVDINLFDENGNLYASSQEEIYDKGLISRKIRPDAFWKLKTAGKSVVIQNEKVADLSYLSSYQPLRDEDGVTLGYINVPFFSSEKDLDFQISNIVVTLINLYAFIFLVSSLLTVFITRWMTSTFDIIIRQFDKLNLEKNERIDWPYDDEIGKLVKEYNKMVKKVEENAARLAQSERETAWREMARQVAHEIKNPLTPMKLNIQYLQQAMRNDNPNIKQLTERVSDSIIEQIDNLSYIASEFSNFAKMPEAKPEDIELSTLLNKALELYTNDEHISVLLHGNNKRYYIVSDKSQLLRVFTNLLENAKQAISPEKVGVISISISADNNMATISITDNGSGINEEVSKRIFQPYFTTKSSGTGLGLAMTKKIIEFWKGEIWFETIENEGTTFFIKLPLTETGNIDSLI